MGDACQSVGAINDIRGWSRPRELRSREVSFDQRFASQPFRPVHQVRKLFQRFVCNVKVHLKRKCNIPIDRERRGVFREEVFFKHR